MRRSFRDPAWLAAVTRRRAPTPPAGAVILWRPSQLAFAIGAPVTAMADEGSWGWHLTPKTATHPTYDEVGGIKAVRYGNADGASHVLGTGTLLSKTLSVATALFIFRPTYDVSPSLQYLADTGVAGTTNRLGFARSTVGTGFGYRGTILNGPAAAPLVKDAWHRAVLYYNGAVSVVAFNGVNGATGDIGSSVSLASYFLGGFGTATTNRFHGLIADVGFWEGDRRTEVDNYARAVLGLP